MEYQKKKKNCQKKLLDNTPSQPCKFRTKNWVKMNDAWRESYHTISQIRFKTTMLKSSLLLL